MRMTEKLNEGCIRHLLPFLIMVIRTCEKMGSS